MIFTSHPIDERIGISVLSFPLSSFFRSFPPYPKIGHLKTTTTLFSLAIYGQNFMSVRFDFHSFKIIGIPFYGYSCILFAFEIGPCYTTVAGLY